MDSEAIRTPRITFNGQTRDIHKVIIYHFDKILGVSAVLFLKLIENGKFKFT